ncbi:MAG: radical SAM family heme chaperone HemW [Gammaproteobacteria bacterium]|nr:radical SAM family heme chaperone HemW [Gammaproteobacteria bacterium]
MGGAGRLVSGSSDQPALAVAEVSGLQEPPLGLYVHLPWCVRKCPYCDFNSHVARDGVPERVYLEAVRRDLELEARRARGRPIHAVFIGGGTPSLFSADAIGRLLESMAGWFELGPETEVTLEANPGTVDAGRFAEFRACGVTRLSIGVQSFDDDALRSLGRIHDARAAHDALERARSAGFERVNVDLMYGLPTQTADAAQRDVRAALAHGPTHLSHYQLTLEPGTVFERRPPELPDDDCIVDMLQRCQDDLQMAGFEHYEVSAYALPGARCAHNLNYWRYGDYLGVGAGAHGKLSDARHDRIERTVKLRGPQAYMQALTRSVRNARDPSDAALESFSTVPPEERIFEFMLNALRLVDGFEPALLSARTGFSIATIEKLLRRLAARQLLDVGPQRIRPTALGLRFLNDILIEFMSENTPGRGYTEADAGRNG